MKKILFITSILLVVAFTSCEKDTVEENLRTNSIFNETPLNSAKEQDTIKETDTGGQGGQINPPRP